MQVPASCGRAAQRRDARRPTLTTTTVPYGPERHEPLAGGAIRALEQLAQAGLVHKCRDCRSLVARLAARQVAALAGRRHGATAFLAWPACGGTAAAAGRPGFPTPDCL